MIHDIRRFFAEASFHEVMIPVLNSAVPTEPNIYPFTTHWNTRASKTELYLSTSPERALKRMLAMGVGNCFGIGHCFRDLEGAGSLHMPEYLMLEWYREQSRYQQIMDDLKNLIHTVTQQATTLSYQGKTVQLTGEWAVFSLPELFEEHTGIPPTDLVDDTRLAEHADRLGYQVTNASWNELFDQIFVDQIEPVMPMDPHFIVDFPTRISPLCKKQQANPDFAERFEFFMFHMEIANGNNENTDHTELLNLFRRENQLRKNRSALQQREDTHFLETIKQLDQRGIPLAGIGLGVDRLAMILADVTEVTDIEVLSCNQY